MVIKMLKKEYENLLNIAINHGADFAEIYYEESFNKTYEYTNSKLDAIKTKNTKGIGFRIMQNGDYYYASTNNLSHLNLEKLMKKLIKNIVAAKKKSIILNDLQEKYNIVKISHKDFSTTEKKQLLSAIDNKIRSTYSQITQVQLKFIENYKKFTIANSTGKFISSDSIHTRYVCQTYAEQDDIKENEFLAIGRGKGYEFLEEINIEEESLEVAKSNVEKLNAKNFKGGEVPVIIGSGFGAVIFHEACGHGLEATSVAPNLSIFANQLGQKVGSEKVTLIDDGTIPGAWGSNIIDDEGDIPQKNILIENGVLKSYLVDKYNSEKMNMKSTGCGRRESYEYAPTSRMSNTYLAPGTDTIEDMIKSIDYGIYCKKLSGGQVNTTTGDFNFGVECAYLIENGKITDRVKGITLIGNGRNILNMVEMVSSDLEINDGYCGSKSGMIPVTCGQPTIKVSKILVGGKQ